MERGDIGDILVQLNRMEDDIKAIAAEVDAVKEARSAYERKLDDISSAVKSGVEEIKSKADEIVTLMGRRGGGRIMPMRSPRAPRSPRASLPKLEYAVRPDRMRTAFVGAACQVTVLHFLHSVPGLRFWSSDRLWTSMLPLKSILEEATGLSVLFFAPMNNNKALFQTEPGKLWSYLTRRVVRNVLNDAKTNVFAMSVSSTAAPDSGGAPESSAATVAEGLPTGVPSTESGSSELAKLQKPAWLDVLGDKDDIRKAVKEAADVLEIKKRVGPISATSSTSSMGSDPTQPSVPKRARLMDKTGPGAMRFRVVNETRYILIQYMNEARGNLRELLFDKLFFLTEKISNEGWTTDEAKRKGFWIEFTPVSVAEEIRVGDPVSLDSPWRKHCVNAMISGQSEAGDINMVRFSQMKKAFPCMNIVLHYKREIERPEASGDAEKHDWSQEINLHEIGMAILMESFKNGEKKIAPGLSALSLKTVHIFALAIRGVLLEKLGENPSEVEALARGSHTGCGRDDTVSLVIDRESSKGIPTKKYLDVMRQKFRVTVQELENMRRDQEARQRQAASSAAAAEAVGAVDDIDDDELLQCG